MPHDTETLNLVTFPNDNRYRTRDNTLPKSNFLRRR